MEKVRMGGLDLVMENFSHAMRDYGMQDQNGISSHPASDISDYAYHQWYHRSFSIPDEFVNSNGTYTPIIAFHGNGMGERSVYYDNIRITRNGKTVAKFYDGSDDYYETGCTTNMGAGTDAVLLTNIIGFKDIYSDNTSLKVRVTDAPYNAVGDGVTNDRAAIQSAIDYVSEQGGGYVIFPSNRTYLSGTIFLKNNVSLFLEDMAQIKQSQVQSHYVKIENGNYVPYYPEYGHDFEDRGLLWDHKSYVNLPFIYGADGVHDIAVLGSGIVCSEPVDINHCNEIIHMMLIGCHRVSNFEVAGITIQYYHTYAACFNRCDHGLLQGIRVWKTWDFNGDGLSTGNCHDMRITGNYILSGDDALYVSSSYNDERMTGTWIDGSDPCTAYNYEFDHNYARAQDITKGFAFMPWGQKCPDASQTEIYNISIHDNDFDDVGAWFGDASSGQSIENSAVKNVRFYNNKVGEFQSNFYDLKVADASGFKSMTSMKNADFESMGEAWWTTVKNTDPNSSGATNEPVGQSGAYCGYIKSLDRGDARIYQGLWLEAGKYYTFAADVQSSGDVVRMSLRNTDTDQLIKYIDFNNTSWGKCSLGFYVSVSGNYRLGIERGTATKGWARIDNASLTSSDNPSPYGSNLTYVINECDSTYGWMAEPAYDTTLSVSDGAIQMVGNSPTQHPIGGGEYVGAMIYNALENAVDLSGYSTISFDYYISESMLGKEGWLQLNFASSGNWDGYNTYVVINGQSAGWHTATLSMNNPEFITGVPYSWNNIGNFRFTWWNTNACVSNMTIKIDNIKVTGASKSTVTYNRNGGIIVKEQGSYTPEGEVYVGQEIKLPELWKKNQFLFGWYDNENFTGDRITTTTATASDNKFYARFGAMGDILQRGKVDVYDALLALRCSLEIQDLDEYQQMAADVDGDKTVTSVDALKILQYTVKLISDFN